MIRFKIDLESTEMLDRITTIYNFKRDTITGRIALSLSLEKGKTFTDDVLNLPQNGREYTPTSNIFGRLINDIDNFVICSIQFQGSDRGFNGIFNIDEISTRQTIFENINIFSIYNLSGENRQYSSIGIQKRLSHSVNILITQYYKIKRNGFADVFYHFFLLQFCDAVKRSGMK